MAREHIQSADYFSFFVDLFGLVKKTALERKPGKKNKSCLFFSSFDKIIFLEEGGGMEVKEVPKNIL